MFAIGCDIGGTNTRCALIEVATGKIVARRRSPSPVGDYFVGYAGIVRDIRALLHEAGAPVPVGVAIAAQLDAQRRRALLAPNLQWTNVPLADDLERSLGVSVQLENDVRAAARGELRYGSLRGVANAACVFWGSGIGGAVVSNGAVVTGQNALAGEVGHMTYVPGGLACGCGKRGCFEAYAGGHALSVRMKKARIPGGSPVDLLRLARQKNRAACKLVDDAVLASACLLANLVNLLDPERVVLGGGLGRALFAPTKLAMRPLVLTVRKHPPLYRPELGDDAGLFGAAALVAPAL